MVVLAAAAPLIAEVLRLPSILGLLALGFGAGAIGALDPNALLGQQLIFAVVSVAVGIILFEAGLGLKLNKLTGTGARVYRWLVSVGIGPGGCHPLAEVGVRACVQRSRLGLLRDLVLRHVRPIGRRLGILQRMQRKPGTDSGEVPGAHASER